MSIKEQIHDLSDEMITNIGRLVAIDSQLGMPGEGKPFGEGPAEALKEGLKIAEELGFKTVNLDNYCGYAEMGEGEEIVGIAGHLDIVPGLGVLSGLMTHLSSQERAIISMDVERQMIKVQSSSSLCDETSA